MGIRKWISLTRNFLVFQQFKDSFEFIKVNMVGVDWEKSKWNCSEFLKKLYTRILHYLWFLIFSFLNQY